MRNQKSIERARKMRKDPTSAEERLWVVVRAGRYRGVKFRRQHAIGPYVVDFACVRARLVIEVDGPSHADAEQAAFDAARTALLERSGWRVVRIPNHYAYGDVDAMHLWLDTLFPRE